MRVSPTTPNLCLPEPPIPEPTASPASSGEEFVCIEPELARTPPSSGPLSDPRAPALSGPVDTGSVSTPVITEAGLLARLGPADAATFLRIESAMVRTESGGAGTVASRLVTTAGPGNPASIGRTQLLVPLQVAFLGRLASMPDGERTLAAHGVSRMDLEAVEARGAAAQRWYDALVGGRTDASSPIPREEARAIVALHSAGDLDAIVARYGDTFAEQTGLPREDLIAMLDTRLLRDPRVRQDYQRIRQEVRREESRSDDPASSAGSPQQQASVRRDLALDRLVEARPELARVRDRLDRDASFEYFLLRPKRNGEHRAAWYTAAARTTGAPFDRIEQGLVHGLDRLTSRLHGLRAFARARDTLTATPGGADLPPERRDSLLARLQRIVHGNPALFLEHFGSPEAPRQPSVEALEGVLATMANTSVASAAGDQGSSVRAFERNLEPAREPASGPTAASNP